MGNVSKTESRVKRPLRTVVPAVGSCWEDDLDPAAICKVKAVVIVLESSQTDDPIICTPESFEGRFGRDHAWGNFLENRERSVLRRLDEAMKEEERHLSDEVNSAAALAVNRIISVMEGGVK